MSNKSFFPRNESQQIKWLTHYVSKLPLYGPSCGINDEEIAATLTDLTYYIWVLQHWHPAQQQTAKEASAYKVLIGNGSAGEIISHPSAIVFPEPPKTPPPGVLKRLFSQIVRIKASVNYNEIIGSDLDIVSISNNQDHISPKFKVNIELNEAGAQRVQMNFRKYGHHGVWIECRINGGEWTFFDKAMTSPFFDDRLCSNGNSHETREYRMRCWDKNIPHGEWSDIQKIVLG